MMEEECDDDDGLAKEEAYCGRRDNNKQQQSRMLGRVMVIIAYKRRGIGWRRAEIISQFGFHNKYMYMV